MVVWRSKKKKNKQKTTAQPRETCHGYSVLTHLCLFTGCGTVSRGDAQILCMLGGISARPTLFGCFFVCFFQAVLQMITALFCGSLLFPKDALFAR